MKLAWDRSGAVAGWVASRIPQMDGAPGFEPGAVAFGVLSEAGEPLGGVVFTDWQPVYRAIQISFASASPLWLTPRLVTAILDYPFAQLACQRITSVTPSQAASALRFLNKFGFVREGLIRRGFGTDDAIISGLLAENWAGHRFNKRAGAQRAYTASRRATVLFEREGHEGREGHEEGQELFRPQRAEQ